MQSGPADISASRPPSRPPSLPHRLHFRKRVLVGRGVMKFPQTYPTPAGGAGPGAWPARASETSPPPTAPRGAISLAAPPGTRGLREATPPKGQSSLGQVRPPGARLPGVPCSEAVLDPRPSRGCPPAPCSRAPAVTGTQPLLGSARQRPHRRRALAENFVRGGGKPSTGPEPGAQ